LKQVGKVIRHGLFEDIVRKKIVIGFSVFNPETGLAPKKEGSM